MPGAPSRRLLRKVRGRLLAWYDREHRPFPWRGTRDPYAVLVSEVMLQQTQAARIADRFPHFMARFPTAEALAAAPPAVLLAEWSGLGYNRRALALQAAAASVVRDGWPGDIARLERLPGVGPYTARAIASLAFDEPVGVVDTNVRRWLVRRFGVADAAKPLQQLSDALAGAGPDARSADWTHATMEFGASVCRPRTPHCETCPIGRGCPSRRNPATVPVARQAPYHGSERAYRGAIVRRLTVSAGHRLTAHELRASLARASARIGPELDEGGWERVLGGLERDRLIHRVDDEIRLAAATIGA